jgi:hypothetical protein
MWSLALCVACRDEGNADDDDTTSGSSGTASETGPSDTSSATTPTSMTLDGTDEVGPTTDDASASTTAETSGTGSDEQCGDGDRGSGELCFGPIVTLVDGRPSASVAVADLDGDGHQDVATAHLDGISVSAGDGLGGFSPPTDVGTGAAAYGLVAVAIDDDDTIDLVASHGDLGEIAVLLGSGDLGFAPSISVPLGVETTPRALTVVDVDTDGLLDVVVLDDLTATLWIVRQEAGATFVPATSVDVGGSPLGIAAGQLDGELGPDLAVTNFAGASVGLLMHTGGVDFSIVDSVGVGQGPRGVVAVDLDGDGALDLATANAESDSASFALGDGEGVFGGIVGLPVGAGPRAIASGDIDNDGTVDLAMASHGASVLSILLQDSAAETLAFLPVGLVNTVLSPDDLAFGDFNEDGLGDLVVASAVANGGVVAHVSDP